MQMKRGFHNLNQKGFTLIELISIMIILGVLGSVVIQKFEQLSDTASARALAAGLKELNVRESMVWTNMKISSVGYTTDEDVFAIVDKNLGAKYKWSPGPTIDGGTLHFENQSISLARAYSNATSAARWH
jgi:prepilin-type N-terminal cleavage/methylation domain-containing protein